MPHDDTFHPRPGFGYVRTLSQQEELPLLRDHLLRLDPESRHDRFNGFLDDSFIERYAEKCADDGTVIVAYMENGIVRGAAELHPPEQSDDALPEVAFSVEPCVRRQGVGSILFQRLISEARWKGYRRLRVTTGAGNHAMRALASKFGAHLVFRHGEFDRHDRDQAALADGPREARDRCAAGRRARGAEFPPRLLEAAFQDEWNGRRGLTRRSRQAAARRA